MNEKLAKFLEENGYLKGDYILAIINKEGHPNVLTSGSRKSIALISMYVDRAVNQTLFADSKMQEIEETSTH